jgi:hypothetical protein
MVSRKAVIMSNSRYALVKLTYGDDEWGRVTDKFREVVGLFDTRALAEAYVKKAENDPPILSPKNWGMDILRPYRYRFDSVLAGADYYEIESWPSPPVNPEIAEASAHDRVAFYATMSQGNVTHVVAVTEDGRRQMSRGQFYDESKAKIAADDLNKRFNLKGIS